MSGLERILEAYGAGGATVEPLGAGLINQTFLVQGPGGRFVLQRLHPVFGAEVNEDIDAVTRHLEAKGVTTPRLLRTRAGALWHVEEGAVWRALTWIDGVGPERLADAHQAREAGRVLATFHRAVADLGHAFRNPRAGVHDTPRHLAALRKALEEHRAHPRHAAVEPLGRRILAMAATLPALPSVTPRIVHGDPKASNVLFTPDGRRAICLVDLDTLARMALPLELGDALRSWCNPAGEDRARSTFSLELFAAAAEGYAGVAGGFVTEAEWRAFAAGTLTIYVELAARFCADALNESYFGWNPREFASRSEHNQVRAESQLSAAASLQMELRAAEAALERAFLR